MTFFVAIACSNSRSGIEISDALFNQLIREQSIKNITFITKDKLFEIELTDSALVDFKVKIDDLVRTGQISNRDDFRLFYLVAEKEFAIESIREVEKENNLKPFDIKTLD